MEIKMTGMMKAFGPTEVLKGVDFHVKSGEIHALVGENGAGKSTLMNVLTGLHKRDGGEVRLNGETVEFASVAESEAAGIRFIHQEINAVPEMTVLANLFLNHELKNRFGWLDEAAMKERALEVFDLLGLKVNPMVEMGSLSVGQQQLVEIAKSLLGQAELIIMDEPTAALTSREIDHLFAVMNRLRDRGVSMVYISHRMDEIFAMCDRLTVMRDGVSVATHEVAETDVDRTVREMVGREIGDFYPEKETVPGEVRLQVKNLTAPGAFRDVSFDVRAGEILGFAGLMGAGRTEVMRALFGLLPTSAGSVTLDGEELVLKDPETAIKQGLGFLTEDRKDEGLILDFSIRENVALPVIDDFTKFGVRQDHLIDEFVELLVERLHVKTSGTDLPAGALSGGNQQKVVLAKWLGIGPKVLILDEPTRGVDVGAKREIYLLIQELAARGVAIIVVSSDLPEVLAISDRVAVLREGELTGLLDQAEATPEAVMQLATGGGVKTSEKN